MPSGAEAAALGNLAARLVPVAAAFVGTVRDEDREGVTEFLAALTGDERAALPVILAAMVPDDRSPAELLAWVTWDEHGRPLPEPATEMASRRRYARTAPLTPCPSPAAYKRHLTNGEDGRACGCLDAENASQRARRAARKVAA